MIPCGSIGPVMEKQIDYRDKKIDEEWVAFIVGELKSDSWCCRKWRLRRRVGSSVLNVGSHFARKHLRRAGREISLHGTCRLTFLRYACSTSYLIHRTSKGTFADHDCCSFQFPFDRDFLTISFFRLRRKVSLAMEQTSDLSNGTMPSFAPGEVVIGADSMSVVPSTTIPATAHIDQLEQPNTVPAVMSTDGTAQSITAGEFAVMSNLPCADRRSPSDEIALYDRQIRLWGVKAQEK